MLRACAHARRTLSTEKVKRCFGKRTSAYGVNPEYRMCVHPSALFPFRGSFVVSLAESTVV